MVASLFGRLAFLGRCLEEENHWPSHNENVKPSAVPNRYQLFVDAISKSVKHVVSVVGVVWSVLFFKVVSVFFEGIAPLWGREL